MNPCGNERDIKSKATAFGTTASVEPDKTGQGMLALIRIYPWPGIGHDQPQPVTTVAKAD